MSDCTRHTRQQTEETSQFTCKSWEQNSQKIPNKPGERRENHKLFKYNYKQTKLAGTLTGSMHGGEMLCFHYYYHD